ncbi:hypothetical protein V8B97DRAFT_1297223 [Scleroderma yunnanense]
MDALIPWPHNNSSGMQWVGPAPVSTFYTPKFDGFPWDESLLHNESLEERKRRIDHENMVDKQIRLEKRREKYSNLWRAFKQLFSDGDPRKVNRLRRNHTLAFIPAEAWGGNNLQVGFRPATNLVRRYDSNLIRPISIDATHNSSAQDLQVSLVRRSPGVLGPPLRDLQLHPLLQHTYTGRTTLSFDIGRPPTGIMFMAGGPDPIPLNAEHLAEPATYPLVPQMHIADIADDPAPTFSHSILVHNVHGITCGDVFETIWRHFQIHITVDEYNSWSGRRRDLAARTYHKRVHEPLDWTQPDSFPGRGDGLRRIDYMGDKVMFRGLEPSPRKDDTWLLFVGPP